MFSPFEGLPMQSEPVYTTPTVNEPILLSQAIVKAESLGEHYPCEGAIRLTFLPEPRLSFEVQLKPPFNSSLRIGDATLEVTGISDPISASVWSNHSSSNYIVDPPTAKGMIRELSFGQTTNLSSVMVHITNFYSFLGSPVRNPAGTQMRNARAEIEFAPWRLTVEGLPQTAGLTDALKESGGFGLTHIARLQRIDGQTFSVEEARPILFRSLPDYLSFCRGFRVGSFLGVGFDADSKPIWHDWTLDRFERWQNVDSWFNELDYGGLIDGFPNYWIKSREVEWGEPIHLALHWYLECNQQAGGVEGSIILGQAAFELLAWTMLVGDRRVLSNDGFKALPAMDKLRLLLSSCAIPLSIPPALKALASAAKEFNWVDGPKALTEVRNALVHSDPDKRKKISKLATEVRVDAWSLVLWYLELTMLFIIGYKGQYINRISGYTFKGDGIESVPWVACDLPALHEV
jgi:hypothetical protein